MSEHQNLMVCTGLTKLFGKKQALTGLNLTLGPGKIVGLLGPNGSGKTTFLKLANGLLQPSGGSILIGGHAPGCETHSIVAYLPDRMYLNDWMRIRDLVDFFADFYADFDLAKAMEMLQTLHLSPSDRLKTLSKGTKQKVQLIVTMARRAQLYLLDEPIGGVDPAARDYILSTILQNYSENSTVVISTHLIADIERVLDEVIFLKEGELKLFDTVDNIREREGKSVDQMFREVFAC